MNLNPSQGLSKHPTPNVSFVSPLKRIQLIWNLFKNWTDTFFLMISCPSQPTPKKLHFTSFGLSLPLSPCLPCVPQSRWMLRTALILDLSSFQGNRVCHRFWGPWGRPGWEITYIFYIYFIIFYKMFFLLTWESSWPSLPPKVESPRIPQDPSGSGTRISMPSGKGPTTCGTRCHVLVAELWRIRGKHLNYISIWLLRLESELHIFAKEFLIGTIPQLMLAWRFGLVVWKSGNSWFYEPNYFNCLIKAWKNRLINNINNTKTAKNNKCQTNL